MNQGSLINNKGMIDQCFYCRLYFIATDACQKTKAAEINTHDRHIMTPDKSNCVKEGAVSAQTDYSQYLVCNFFSLMKRFSIRGKRNSVFDLFVERMKNNRLKFLGFQFIKK